MKRVIIKQVCDIYKRMFKALEDSIDKEFISKYPNAILPINGGFNSNSDQFLVCGSGEDYEFPQSIYKEIRLMLTGLTKDNEIIISINESGSYEYGKVDSYKVTNPLLIEIMNRSWTFDVRGYRTLSSEYRTTIQHQSRTFVETAAMSESLEKMLIELLSNFKFDFKGTIILSVSGCGGYSYNEEKNEWNRIYGKPVIKVKPNAELITIGYESRS